MQKATVGGILSIVSGALGVLGGLILLMIALAGTSFFNSRVFYDVTVADERVFHFVVAIYAVMGIIGLIVGALAIVGGVFSIQRKRWGWALAGAIASVFAFFPTGIAAVILVAMGQQEFAQGAVPTPSQP